MKRPERPSGSTEVVAVIGDPVAHSLSPSIHNAAFVHDGLDYLYVAFRVEVGNAGRAVEAMRYLGLAGLSVTMPHKSEIARHVDELTDRAAALGAVNCVYRGDSGLVGDNTDGEGFVLDLSSRHGFDVRGTRCVVFGAGGAARSIVYSLAEHGAESIVVVNRTLARAELVADLAPGVARVGDVGDVEGSGLVVNATSIGMAPAVGDSPCPPNVFGAHQLVVDVVYHPLSTRFMADATSAGARVVNGVGMLVGQAAVAYQHWTGRVAPHEVMYDSVTAQLAG